MSKEAIGQNGERLGSAAYWNKLNQNTILREVMGTNAPTDYYDALRNAGERASSAIGLIYQDLSKRKDELFSVGSTERNALAKQVKGLYDVCKLTGKSAMHSDDCIRALNADGNRSIRNERAVEQSIQYITRNRYYSAGETLSMLKEASKWSISFAAGGDRKKEAYLKTIAQDKGEKFLKEVLEEYRHRQGDCDCRGQCGHTIGSNRYLDWVEASFVAKSLPLSGSARWGSPLYAPLFQDALQSVTDQLERDLDAADRVGDYITDATKTHLKAVVAELSRCGASTTRLNDKIDKLAWFVGGDKSKIKELQHLLNELLGGHIEEDGVYGEETDGALERLAKEILKDTNKYLKNSTNLDALDKLCVRFAMSGVVRTSGFDLLVAAILAGRKEIQRFIWEQGAEHILRRNGLVFSAELLEHALKKNPTTLSFSRTSVQSSQIKKSRGIQNALKYEIEKIAKSRNFSGEGRFDASFYNIDEKDFELSIGKATVYYTYIKKTEFILVSCKLSDDYNFDALRTVYVDEAKELKLDFSFPALANDVGLFSQADGVLTPYKFTVAFDVVVSISDESGDNHE